MKIQVLGMLLLLLIGGMTKSLAQAQENPWQKNQLKDPKALAETLQTRPEAEWPLIVAVNPDGMHGLPYEGGIPGSKWFGPATEQENLAKLAEFLQHRDREEALVLYCGCCPFSMCPNVRPAFKLLTDMGFSNHQLLNLSENIKVDWMDKGYPMKND